ncbi:MAG: NTP transferase domain-containing protein [Candidatus Bipolaricaulia bacterium]
MDFVILAAGDGTRMHGKSPKPLIKLSGQPILKHVINRLAEVNPD